MKTIWKHALEFKQATVLHLTPGADILTAQVQAGNIQLWEMHLSADEKRHPVLRTFVITGTGHEISGWKNLKYIATVQEQGYVWHVFEKVAS